MEIPTLWLFVSGAFFTAGIVAFIAVTILLIRLLGVINELQPKVNGLVERVDEVSKKVDAISTTVKSTVENVGGRATSLATSVESIAATSANVFGKVSGYIMIGSAIIKLFREFQAARSPSPRAEPIDKPGSSDA